jgi:Cu/Ag efflux protein CusF
MKRSTTLLTVLLVGVSLAACGQKADAQKTAATEPAPAMAPAMAPAGGSAMSTMAEMPKMAADAKMAKGTGTVTAVDAQAGTITLDHQPIPEINWPAMTMAFKASPAIVGQVKTGDKVAFDLMMQGGSGEVTAVTKVN